MTHPAMMFASMRTYFSGCLTPHLSYKDPSYSKV